ncbi:MAG TPA: acetyl-CoA hydrolase/transferase C-terminal domain-containing protein [Steroidobacteraceae bacterium]|nr:acetyl-CoA hydrolase/transferase C-terminal domain-containing protein [Steroidobacteraceae bacterium]
MPKILDDVADCVEAVLHRVGPRIVLAMPLGIGKPNPIVNEFYRRARADRGIDLTILTALSLLKPVARVPLEARLLNPIVTRVFGSYVEPEYAQAVARDTLPPNIRVIEFFLTPGAFLHSQHAQRHYLSAIYTQVARDALARGVNVIAQLLARRTIDGKMQLSFGSNTDVIVDLLPQIAQARHAGRDLVLLGETHAQMPFMLGTALVAPERFDFLLDHPRYDYDLFAPPNPPLVSVDHAIGLWASSLVRDGGTLQIGIGELGDAQVYAMLLRHQENSIWRGALAALGAGSVAGLIRAEGGDAPFAAGLFASTEMFVDQLLGLYRAGILRRQVYDSLPLERLLASGQISERIDASILPLLISAGVGAVLSAEEFAELRRFGVFRADVEFADGRVRRAGGEWIAANLADPASRARLATECLGSELRGGEVLHAGFFLGPRAFYEALHELPEADRARFDMRGVGYINQLYGADQELRVLQRRDARHINTAMMVTLLGAAVSDQLESGQVVSGIGGQYNFVTMAHALPGARSILCARASRTRHGRASSNIIWSYGHETIPRYLRDIVITEYGIADLRGRTDEEVIAALLNVADSRFQESLLTRAKAAGKIRADYRIPDAYRANLPERLERALREGRAAGHFSAYPFGTDLTTEEIALGRALKFLDAHSGTAAERLKLALAALTRGAPGARYAGALARMGLDRPRTLDERWMRRLVLSALDATQ